MDERTKEEFKLTTKEVLLCFCDVFIKLQEIFGYKMHRDLSKKYWRWRENNRQQSARVLWRLEKQGYIKRDKQNKDNFIKLTSVGNKHAIKYFTDSFEISKPAKWDKKWRIVIFDIPKDKKVLRDVVRNRLKKWGFYKLQKSVFVYPFDCQKEIKALKYLYNLDQYLQFIVAETIDMEQDLIKMFNDQGILEKNR